MEISSTLPVDLLILVTWALPWSVGGVWLIRSSFRLQDHEQMLAGIALGFLLQNWLVNWLARIIPFPLVSWLASILVLAAGFVLAWRSGRGMSGLRVRMRLGQLVAFAALLAASFMIGRGMAIFDDFAHLPTVSIMATGDIPPHFSLDPNVLYGYHHFLLLFSAQVMRVASLPPWVAIDAGRALSFALAVMLSGLWVQRVTGSRAAGMVGGAMIAFGSGTRWLLLFLPLRILDWISRNVNMIGSGSASGETLTDSLANFWAVQGSGPISFPYAFANGIFPAGVISFHSANGLVSYVVMLLLLLTCSRWLVDRRRLLPAGLTAVIFSTWGLLSEAELIIFLGGWGLVALVVVIQRRSLRLPSGLWLWLGAIGGGGIVGLLVGGAWTDLIHKLIIRVTTGVMPPSYQTVGFQFGAPAIVSSHLGALSILNPAQLLMALLEMGPVILVLPCVAIFGWKAFRLRRWYESAFSAAALLAVLMIFVQFTGSTGVRNTPRLYVFMPVCVVLAVPLTWWWARRRSAALKTGMVAAAWVTMMGGVVLLGIELIAIQRPVVSYFITDSDVAMYQKYWNRLDPNSMVFDPVPSRSGTLFGRFSDAAYTWYQYKPQWQALREKPDPAVLQQAGYGYFYLEEEYYDQLGPEVQGRLKDPCVVLVDQVEEGKKIKRLLDIRSCR